MSTYLDLILLLVLAVLVFLRLRSVLGTRPEDRAETRILPDGNDLEQQHIVIKAVSIPEEAKIPTPVEQELSAVANFSEKEFCRRCAYVFEIVIKAFANADESTLKMLLSHKLFTKFRDVIKQRQAEGISAETDLIRLEDVCIEQAKISPKGVAKVVVKFISEQINLIKNAAGEVIEGDENFIQKITDIWTFEHDIHSGSPVWYLVSTKKG